MTGRRRPVAHFYERPDREHRQHRQLDAEKGLLEVGRDLDADVADRRHGDDPRHADEQYPDARGVVPDARGVEEVEQVLAGHLGQARHDEDVSGDDAPAAEPAGLRAERPRRPRESGAAVRVGLVELVVADRDEVHRDEGEDRDDRRLQADGDDDEAERRRQAVGRRRRGHPDHHARDEPERSGLQPFLCRTITGQAIWTRDHGSSPFRRIFCSCA